MTTADSEINSTSTVEPSSKTSTPAVSSVTPQRKNTAEFSSKTPTPAVSSVTSQCKKQPTNTTAIVGGVLGVALLMALGMLLWQRRQHQREFALFYTEQMIKSGTTMKKGIHIAEMP